MNDAPAPFAIASTIASPRPLPFAAVAPRSNGFVRRSSSAAASTGPRFVTLSAPAADSATRTGSAAAPCLSAFSTRLRTTIANASGSIREVTAVSGNSSAIARSRAPRRKSSTTSASTGRRSCGVSASTRPSSAFASCISCSLTRDSVCSAPSTRRARSRNGSAGASAISRCVCASAAAIGVRSSCALFAAKLRSAASARSSRAISSVTASATGAISAGSPPLSSGVRSLRPRAAIAPQKRRIGVRPERTISQIPSRPTGRNSASGLTTAKAACTSARRRVASGSAISSVTVPCSTVSA
ncbi:sensor histidine kinase domain protein [Burkholderia mallei]|nr:hypothetical protein DM46_2995 [Burkholderia mallei]KOT22153.1 sensor histidine kinase domain protein [Burkholderia mallei]KOT25180.1 putative two-component sensor histidine kinase transcriptional regulatory domain protein [Burkholderia mallei]